MERTGTWQREALGSYLMKLPFVQVLEDLKASSNRKSLGIKVLVLFPSKSLEFHAERTTK